MAAKKRDTLQEQASKGGLARAASLSPAERQDIARKAVQVRWAKTDSNAPVIKTNKELPPLPYSMFRGTLQIGNVEIEVHVLNDLRRVMTQREVLRVITGGSEGGNLGPYLDANPLINKDLLLGGTFQFKVPGNPRLATGFEATQLIEICTAYLEAREQNKLTKNQQPLAWQAEIVIRACAKVGIIALIDEATGYQKIRAKHALQLKLQAFISDDIQEWAEMFSEEFWLELARLEGVKYSPRNRPIRWGKYVMMFVYDAVDKDVGRQLRKINPDPHFLKNHHQWLKLHGREKVNNQIQRIIGIMKTCADMTDFRQKFSYIFKTDPLQFAWDEWVRPS